MAGGGEDVLGLDDAALLRACEVDVFRASGPGGQKRNKVESAVRLRHRSSGLIVIAVESRSQHENRARALRRLRHRLAIGLRGDVDCKEYAPSDRLAAYTRGRKISVSVKNAEYPVILHEILDVTAACGGRVPEAAALMGLSTSQLIKFLRRDTHAWAYVQDLRHQHNLGPLRA